MTKVSAVILAGGQGARFWPISRKAKPKQFLSPFPTGESLLQATVRRILPLVGRDNVVVVANSLHRELILEHVSFAKVISEPIARNTAPAIGLAALHLLRADKAGLMLVLPADHMVRHEPELLEVLKRGIEYAAQKEVLVTFGLKPESAHSGYGYIQSGEEVSEGIYAVRRFYEKPSVQRARKYLETPNYYWNSGMFVWRASVLLEGLREYMPQLYEGLQRISSVIGTAKEHAVTAEVFEKLEPQSIDFGVLEHARNCVVVAGDGLAWSDVGSWDVWAECFESDSERNLYSGDVLFIDSKDCIVNSKQRFSALLGVSGVVVIDAGDALLVCSKDRVQDVKRIVLELEKRGRKDLV